MKTVTPELKKYKYTVGMDISDKTFNLCVLDEAGDIVSESSHVNDMETALEVCKLWSCPGVVCVAMESGTHSPWLSHLFKSKGFDVLVGNPRKLKAIWANDVKTDVRDAQMLARIARFDPKLLYPIKHRSLDAHKDLAVIKSRDLLVKARSRLVSSIRGQLKCFGVRPPECSTPSFPKQIRAFIPDGLHAAVDPLLDVLLKLNAQIKGLDKTLGKLAEEKYPEVKELQKINGVGPITAMAFVLTLESPRFLRGNRDVGPYLGLIPRKDSSGESDKDLSITKAGNRMLRTLLVGSAQYILGHFGKDCDLRRHGLKLVERSGPRKTAKRKAVVAVARKLAVMMHAIWRDQTEYVPLKKEAKKAATIQLAG